MDIIQEGDNWRVGLVVDEVMYDDSYIDTWGETDERKAEIKRKLWVRIEAEGVWGLVGEVRCPACGAWEHVDSVGGFVGNDWKGSGYDKEILEQVKAKAELWNNDLVQFARLLDEITATFSEIDFPRLRESMDLPQERIDELFERARRVWEAAKRKHT